MPPDRRKRSGRSCRSFDAWFSPHTPRHLDERLCPLEKSSGDRRCAAIRLYAGWRLRPDGCDPLNLVQARQEHRFQPVELVCRAAMAHPRHLADLHGNQAQARHLSQCLPRTAYLAHAAGAGLCALQFRPQHSLRSAGKRRGQRCHSRHARRSAAAAGSSRHGLDQPDGGKGRDRVALRVSAAPPGQAAGAGHGRDVLPRRR